MHSLPTQPRFDVLATDYDETIAENGVVHRDTLRALQRFRDSGRHVVLVTGRELPSLQRACPDYGVFHLAVCENGGLMYDPATGEESPLGPLLPPEFLASLRRRKVGPLALGRVLVGTLADHTQSIESSMEELGLDYHLIFNKDWVMALPSGVDKGSGLHAALRKLGRSHDSTVVVGDAENDIHLLKSGAFPVAVQNALPALRPHARFITGAHCGGGICELIDLILTDRLIPSSANDLDSDLLVNRY